MEKNFTDRALSPERTQRKTEKEIQTWTRTDM